MLGTALVGLGLVEVMFGGIGGLWLALIGWFIFTSSNAERYVAGLDRLRGTTAATIMSPCPVIVPNWWTVTQLLDELQNHHPQDIIPVVDFAGQLSGVISLRQLIRVPPADRDATRLRDISATVPTLASGAPVADCLPAVQRGATVVVADAGRPLGLITPAELTQALLLATLRDRSPHDDQQPRTAA